MFTNKLASELFKEFTENVLLEHKNNKKVHDECIEIYAKTQLFDISHVNLDKIHEEAPKHTPNIQKLENNDLQIIYDSLNINLPFESIFIKGQYSTIFIREFNQITLTGCYIRAIKEGCIYKQPFTINYLLDKLIINYNSDNLIHNINKIYSNTEEGIKAYQYFLKFMIYDIYVIAKVFEKLQQQTIIIDEPTENKATYYRYKDKSKGAKKVNNKPIYIILDKEKKGKKYDYSNIKKQGVLKYDFAFPVIGHWRKLSDSRKLGKDRQGNYNIQGYTWVKSFIKGNKDGIIQQKERIILN